MLSALVENSELLVTIEEQAREGAFGAAILEAISDLGLMTPTLRLSLSTAYAFENGSRDELLDLYGLSRGKMKSQILEVIKKMTSN